MRAKAGDEVVISFIGKVTEIFTSPHGVDLIKVNSGGIEHTFWPADEQTFQATVLARIADL
tara:strand:+ start:1853 stop:2035 length:183 start_codon:yes stop_codon:yes gene_type:complete